MKIKFNGNDVNITTPDDLMAELYRAQLESVAKAFELEAQQATRAQVKTAIHDPELLAQLADILDEYVAIGVSIDLQTAPLMKVPRRLEDPAEKDSDKTIGLVAPKADKPNQKMSRCQAVLYYTLYLESDLNPNLLTDLDTIFGSGYQSPKGTQPRKDKDAYEKYFSWFINKNVIQGGSQKSGIDAFYERYPIIKHIVDKNATNFQNNIIAACKNIWNDWNLIFNIFMKDDNFKDAASMTLTKIASTGNDFHKGGKQVLILTFSNDNKGSKTKKLVYKPADVEMDYRLVGDTSIATSPNLGYLGKSRSLTEIINGFFPRDDPYQLPTYRILPRNPGSSLTPDVNNNNRIPIEKSYGYIEFLTHEVQDWITDSEDTVEKFYLQWGRLLAIASLFALSDLHQGNVIVHACQPYLIDLEVAFTGPMEGVAGTLAGMGLKLAKEDVESSKRMREAPKSPLFKMGGWTGLMPKDSNNKTNNRIWLRKKVGTRMVQNMLEPDNYASQINSGYQETLYKIFWNEANIRSWLDSTKECIARFTPYATGDFQKALRTFYSTFCIAQFPEFPLPTTLAADHPLNASARTALNEWTSPANDKWPVPRPNYAIHTTEHSWKDYLNCDVPSYYHRLRETDLLNARGEKVKIDIMHPGLKNPRPPDRVTYFPQSTWSIAEQQVNDFFDKNDPVKRLQRQRACATDMSTKWFGGKVKMDSLGNMIKINK